MTDLEQQLTDHLRERAAAATPRYDLEAVEAGLSSYAPVDLDERRRRRLLTTAVVGVAAAVALVVAIAVVREAQDGDTSTPVTEPGQDLTTFVSPRNGFSVDYPDGEVSVTPATGFWDPGNEDEVNDGVDVVETASGAVFTGGSLEDPGEFPTDDWASIDDYIDDLVSPVGCGVPRSQQAEIIIDGQSGRISECQGRIEATVVSGRRIYGFTLLHDGSDARAEFDAFAATIRLTPETAVDIPPLETTFVSPTYGYSFRYFDRGEGTLTPATEIWDPANQPLGHINFDPRFDAVETGLAAYLEAASTPIPDRVSIDEWVDEYVTPLAASGCGVPRSQQAEITIDGQPGRIAQCANRVEATVVAGGRLYLFVLSHGARSDARAFFDAWVATIDLRPEAAEGF
jgi:hypothetical protein